MITGAMHNAASSNKFKRLRLAFSDMRRQVVDQDRKTQREPLECVPVVLADTQVGCVPFAQQSVANVVFLADEHGWMAIGIACR
jgi:hypothetical protein